MPQLELISTLGQLVQIPSVNPAFASDPESASDESLLASCLEKLFHQIGACSVDSEPVDGNNPQRRNVYAYFQGNTSETLAWDIHMDTVGVAGMSKPFSGRQQDAKVFGRGSVDTKASFALALDLLSRGQRPGPNVLIAATCGEEAGGIGAKFFANYVKDRYSIDRLIIAEPTDCTAAFAQKGAIWLKVSVEGSRGHSANPESCNNPIDALFKIGNALNAERDSLKQVIHYGDHATLECTSVQAGHDNNSIADSCELKLDRRLVPGECVREVGKRLESVIKDAVDAETHFDYQLCVEPLILADPVESGLVKQVSALTNSTPTMTRLGTNAGFYSEMPAKEAIIFGPGSIEQAHQANEWVIVSELEKARQVMASLLEIQL